MPGHTKCCTCHTKSSSQNWRSDAPKLNPLRKSAPWPLNISDAHVSCTAPATRNASVQILFKCPTPAIVPGNATNPSRFAHFWEGAQSLAPATRNNIWTSKSAPNPVSFLEMRLAPQQHALFDISTSKSGPRMVCFVHFDLEMCFAPQQRALFRHRNFQSAPTLVCFVRFDFEMCLAPQRRALFRHLNFKSAPKLRCFVQFDFEICFAPQRRAIFHLSSGQMAPHPPV